MKWSDDGLFLENKRWYWNFCSQLFQKLIAFGLLNQPFLMAVIDNSWLYFVMKNLPAEKQFTLSPITRSDETNSLKLIRICMYQILTFHDKIFLINLICNNLLHYLRHKIYFFVWSCFCVLINGYNLFHVRISICSSLVLFFFALFAMGIKEWHIKTTVYTAIKNIFLVCNFENKLFSILDFNSHKDKVLSFFCGKVNIVNSNELTQEEGRMSFMNKSNILDWLLLKKSALQIVV